MIYEQDWIMRQIQMTAQFIAKAFLKKDFAEYGDYDESNMSHTDILHRKLCELVLSKKICEAENLLFDNFRNTSDFLKLAVSFYDDLNSLDDDELDANDFSREEIKEGLDDIMRRFGITYFT